MRPSTPWWGEITGALVHNDLRRCRIRACYFRMNRFWSLQPLKLGLYGGQAGMLLLLAYLGALTGEGRYRSLAESALASLRRMIDRDRSTLKEIGYANGWGGI